MVLAKASTLPRLLHLHSRPPYGLCWHHHPTPLWLWTCWKDGTQMCLPKFPGQNFIQKACSALCVWMDGMPCGMSPPLSMYVITDGQNCMIVSYSKQSECEVLDWMMRPVECQPSLGKLVTHDCENCVTVLHFCIYHCVYDDAWPGKLYDCMCVCACHVKRMTGKIYTLTNMAGDQTLFKNTTQDLNQILNFRGCRIRN